MQEFFTGTILGIASGIVGSYVFFKVIIGPKIRELQLTCFNLKLVYTGLFKDGSVLLALQNVLAERLGDVEEKLEIDRLTIEDYEQIQIDVLNHIDGQIQVPDK